MTDTVWLSGVVGPPLMKHARRPDLGMLAQPGTMSYLEHVDAFGDWGFDNGCFADFLKPGTFDPDDWWAKVLRLPTGDRAPLFVAAPDRVADCHGTWERSRPWLSRIRDAGHRAAYVFQDGIELEPETIPWDLFDVAFMGGSDEWKLANPGRYASPLSRTVFELIALATEHGKPSHVGRVNSGARYLSCCEAGAATCDGTFFQRAGFTEGIGRVLRWFERRDHHRAQLSLI